MVELVYKNWKELQGELHFVYDTDECGNKIFKSGKYYAYLHSEEPVEIKILVREKKYGDT